MPVHVIKKGDTLIKIAKQYGIKDWRKGLYEHKDNQAFRKKNPDPEVLQVGEKLVIPEAEGGAHPKEAAREKAIVEQKVKDVEAVISRLKKVRKEIETGYAENVKHSEAIYSEMKKMSGGVDVAATILLLCVSLTKLGIQGAQVAKASAEEAAKMADELAKDTAKDIGKKWLEAGGAAVKATPGESTVWLFGQSVADAWFKLQSPSFWAHTYVQIAKEGKSWSEAVTYDPEEEHKEALAKLESGRTDALRSIDEKIKGYERALAALKKGG